VDRVAAYAVLVGAVEVAHPLEPVRDGRADEPRLRGRQFLVGELPDRERPGPAVVGVLPAWVVLHQLERRQHVSEGPAVGAVRAPLGEVSGPRPDPGARGFTRSAPA